MFAYRELSEEEYNNFDKAFKIALNNLKEKLLGQQQLKINTR